MAEGGKAFCGKRTERGDAMKRIGWGKGVTLLWAAVCVSLTALSATAGSPGHTVMAQVEGIPIYSDVYCYLLSEALRDAPKDEKGKPEDMSSLREDVLRRCVSLVAVHSELHNRERSIDTQSKATIAERAAFAWRSFRAYYGSIGVNKQTINSILAARAAREQLFLVLYDTGGAREVPEDEIEGFFYDNYAAYNGVRVFLVHGNDDGSERLLTNNEIKGLRSALQKLVDEINGGKDFLDAAMSGEYAQNLRYAVPMGTTVQKGSPSVTEEEFAKVRALKPGKASLLEFSSSFLVAVGIDMKKKPDEYYRSSRTSCLWALKGEDYEETLRELCASFRADENTAAVNRLLARWEWRPPEEKVTLPEEDTSNETTLGISLD
jgi:hypothetical protein